MHKKELKKLINDKGIFLALNIGVEKNAPEELKAKVPEGATYFEGIASTGEFNRNGYKIKKEAWVPAISGFMKNPVILLQHNTSEPIGQCLFAEVTDKGLEVKGYIYDDLTGGRFGRGLIKSLSTGHFTLEVEFEHSKTGEVINEQQFRALPYENEKSVSKYDEWILIVSKLEWVEFSLVTIGSNRKSFVTKKNAIKAYEEHGKLTETALKNYLEFEDGGKADEEDLEDEDKTETKTNANTETAEKSAEEIVEIPEKAGEIPEKTAEEPEKGAETVEEKNSDGSEDDKKEPENGSDAEENKIVISDDDRDRLKKSAEVLETVLQSTIAESEANAKKEPETTPIAENKTETQPTKSEENKLAELINNAPEVRDLLQTLVNTVETQSKEISELKTKIENQPNNKALVLNTQFNTPKKTEENAGAGIRAILNKAGIKI